MSGFLSTNSFLSHLLAIIRLSSGYLHQPFEIASPLLVPFSVQSGAGRRPQLAPTVHHSMKFRPFQTWGYSYSATEARSQIIRAGKIYGHRLCRHDPYGTHFVVRLGQRRAVCPSSDWHIRVVYRRTSHRLCGRKIGMCAYEFFSILFHRLYSWCHRDILVLSVLQVQI